MKLGEKFFKAVIAAPIPLDMRALKALKRSPLALDLYSWLTYEAYRAHKSGKGRSVAWKLLAEQMGTDYADIHDFQKKAVATLRKIKALYPALKLGQPRGGIRIEPDSLPAITPRPTPTVEYAAKPEASEPPPQPDTEEQLAPPPVNTGYAMPGRLAEMTYTFPDIGTVVFKSAIDLSADELRDLDIVMRKMLRRAAKTGQEETG